MTTGKNNTYWIHYATIDYIRSSIRTLTLTTDKPFIEVEDWAHENCPEGYELTSIEKTFVYREEMLKAPDLITL